MITIIKIIEQPELIIIGNDPLPQQLYKRYNNGKWEHLIGSGWEDVLVTSDLERSYHNYNISKKLMKVSRSPKAKGSQCTFCKKDAIIQIDIIGPCFMCEQHANELNDKLNIELIRNKLIKEGKL
jgi:hypothetical protein